MTLPTAIATGRVNIAFDDGSLVANPTWTRIDDSRNLVASYTIDRGRQYELDRTDGGRALVRINDRNGVLDPTNPSGIYYGKIEPLLQITLGRYNPVLAEWQTRFRGFIAEYDYLFDPSQRINYLELTCVDLFEILQSIEMTVGDFGDTPPAESAGQIFYDNANVQTRIDQIYGDCNLPSTFYVTFTGNVTLYETVYSPSESAMTAVQEAVDAEWPGVGNLYTDRFGRLRAVFHGRLAKFNPATIAAGAGNQQWDWHHWHCGDQAAMIAAPSTTALIREFSFNRGLSKIINSALATPLNIADADVAGQLVQDTTSIGLRGIRSWSAQNLLTKTGLLTGNDALAETKQFAQFYVDNYAAPNNRVTVLGFGTTRTGATGAAILWRLLCESDIADQIDVTISSPGGGGFTATSFFIEGIHEESRPLNATFDDVSVRFDVSPTSYFNVNPYGGARAVAVAVARPGTASHT